MTTRWSVVDDDADWVFAEDGAVLFGAEFELDSAVGVFGGVEIEAPFIFVDADVDFFAIDEEVHIGFSGLIFDPAREADGSGEFLFLGDGTGCFGIERRGAIATHGQREVRICHVAAGIGGAGKEIILADDAPVKGEDVGVLGDGVVVVFSVFEGEIIGVEVVDAFDARVLAGERFVHSDD